MGIFDKFKRNEDGEARRRRSNKKIKAMGIACFEQLPTIEESSQVKL